MAEARPEVDDEATGSTGTGNGRSSCIANRVTLLVLCLGGFVAASTGVALCLNDRRADVTVVLPAQIIMGKIAGCSRLRHRKPIRDCFETRLKERLDNRPHIKKCWNVPDKVRGKTLIVFNLNRHDL